MGDTEGGIKSKPDNSGARWTVVVPIRPRPGHELKDIRQGILFPDVKHPQRLSSNLETHSLNSRLANVWASISGLPSWVKIWLVILATSNMLSLAFLDTESGIWTAIAFAIVGMLNMPMVFVQGGLTRLLSIPHFVWVPLLVYLYPRLIGPNAISHADPQYLFMLLVFVVNGVSLLFDALEGYRWLSGRREILGLSTR